MAIEILNPLEILSDLSRQAREFMFQQGFHYDGEFDETSGEDKHTFAGRDGDNREHCWLKCKILDKNPDNPGLLITFGSFHSDLPKQVSSTFFSGRESISSEEAEHFTKRVEEQRKKAAERKKIEQEKEAKILESLRQTYESASLKGKSPYFERKGIVPPEDIRFITRKEEMIVLVPFLNSVGELVALQEIYPSKRKISAKDKKPRDKNFIGKIAGCFYTFGTPKDGTKICIGEGFVTTASVHLAEGTPSVMAITCGNLLNVGKQIKGKFPNSEIIICGDYNKDGSQNPEAIETAKALGCNVIFPVFPNGQDRDKDGKVFTDFNDLHVNFGIEAVREQLKIESKKTPVISKKEVFEALNDNEVGDANLFLKLYGDRYLYDPFAKNYYVWNGYYWSVDEKKTRYEGIKSISEYFDSAANEVKEMIGNCEDAARAKELEKTQKSLVARSYSLKSKKRMENVLEITTQGSSGITFTEEWDHCPYHLPCSNGVVDLRSGKLVVANPKQFIRKVSPTHFNPSAECPIFKKFLSEIMLGDEELISFLVRLLGYAIFGSPKEHIFFIFYGKNGRNGKGTLLRTLEKVLGTMARTLSPEMLLMQRSPPSSGTPRPDLVHLQGTRLAIFSEINEGRKLDSSQIKNLSGGDTISCRPLFSNTVKNFQPSHTIFIQTNYKPKAPSDDNALWKRAVLVPFDAEFVENPTENQKKIDVGLEDKLIEEASGILNLLVAGCLSYQRDGLKPPQKVKDATEGYREENDGIGAFLRERCDAVPELSTRCCTMREAIILFCEQEGYQRPTHREIAQYLQLRKYQKFRLRDGEYWRGITLKKEEPETHSM